MNDWVLSNYDLNCWIDANSAGQIMVFRDADALVREDWLRWRLSTRLPQALGYQVRDWMTFGSAGDNATATVSNWLLPLLPKQWTRMQHTVRQCKSLCMTASSIDKRHAFNIAKSFMSNLAHGQISHIVTNWTATWRHCKCMQMQQVSTNCKWKSSKWRCHSPDMSKPELLAGLARFAPGYLCQRRCPRPETSPPAGSLFECMGLDWCHKASLCKHNFKALKHLYWNNMYKVW